MFNASSNSVLGVEFDTISLEARLPPEKIQKSQGKFRAILDKRTITVAKLRSWRAAHSGIRESLGLEEPSSNHLMPLSSRGGGPRPSIPQRLLSRVQRELTWWRDLLPVFNGVHLLDEDHQTPALVWT